MMPNRHILFRLNVQLKKDTLPIRENQRVRNNACRRGSTGMEPIRAATDRSDDRLDRRYGLQCHDDPGSHGAAGLAGLVAHYFGDKDGLLEATMRHLAARAVRAASRRGWRRRARRASASRRSSTRNSAPSSSTAASCDVWLAFWGQVPAFAALRAGVQHVYQRRIASNLAARPAQAGAARARCGAHAKWLAAMIDGLWLRATLSGDERDDSRPRHRQRLRRPREFSARRR